MPAILRSEKGNADSNGGVDEIHPVFTQSGLLEADIAMMEVHATSGRKLFMQNRRGALAAYLKRGLSVRACGFC